ncbi:MAG: hypothetical protein GF346_01830, partial [Candidatus Eisenbacteria bacterium]|nr:hypothetical protein [Candidatus Latescibacterota bacterium]MBD3301170.1 hypothetical protein [Candidatus Eisenbacteria bacterium]
MGRARKRLTLRGNRLAILLIFAGLPALFGCQDADTLLPPSETDESVLRANYRSSEEFLDNPIVLDGQAIDREWGGGTIPYYNVRISTEEGVGTVEAPQYVSMKAVYTNRDLYLLIRWADDEVDALKDATLYVGEPLAEIVGECSEQLISERSWIRDPGDRYDEDRFGIAFEVDSAGSSIGTFREHGCQIACHAQEEPAFGRTGYGRLDIWQWLAARTNPVRDLYIDTENPVDPLHGIPGYLDDLIADDVLGLSPDPGTPAYRPNFVEGSDVPLYVYRLRDDPFARPVDPERCFNEFGEQCRKNNGVDLAYIWREETTQSFEPFGPCDTLNLNPLPIGTEPHEWQPPDYPFPGTPGDLVAGWYLTYPT